MTEFRRKLYKRGSSFETTIPMPLLFALDKKKKYHVIFALDEEASKWYIKFEELGGEKQGLSKRNNNNKIKIQKSRERLLSAK